MGKIKGWKKQGLITSSSGTTEETYFRYKTTPLVRVSVTRWGADLLRFPNTTVFVEEDTGRSWKQVLKKDFFDYDNAKQFALDFMRMNS